MTAIIRKLRRKRKLSSELHSRWGDVSITYPTEGSWSQWDHPSSINMNVAPELPSEQRRRHSSPEARHRESNSSRPEPTLHAGDSEGRESSVDSAMTIPTGHYDAKLRSGSTKELPRRKSHSTAEFDEADEDIIPLPKGPKRLPQELNRLKLRAHMDDYSRASKSPPLSVTSRMRRRSQQSNVTEPTASVSGTTSSKHTSFTSSVPSVLPEDSRHMSHSPFQEQKLARRSKHRETEPVREPELVPSYDELYG
ncbi:uncharacterized protein P174DRAFT_421983 [Aspergillus novofumigatus IBT 16806]|uniref:Uncharacterized protein n=1 Tax=Aspergillus novofumigatus (strain IBT 16806) TaxID=1392255 RepID=A0A2I1C5R9_ASPN1|nr:uncharacterized protein P174DRAFT_421983 [Aspergillus novofumigatus IBT 16806]PKX92956.1 hypothetical protein P174DRAFT_421983 [Aspergillus novofumigatus IBT 16806]